MPASTLWQWLLQCVFPMPSVVDAECPNFCLRLDAACHQLALVRFVFPLIVMTLTFFIPPLATLVD
jgi:hypothetical protein